MHFRDISRQFSASVFELSEHLRVARPDAILEENMLEENVAPEAMLPWSFSASLFSGELPSLLLELSRVCVTV